MSLFQTYAPTSTATEDEAAEFYGKLQETIDTRPSQDVLLVMGDFSAKVGHDIPNTEVEGHYGLGEMNAQGEKLINFPIENVLKMS